MSLSDFQVLDRLGKSLSLCDFSYRRRCVLKRVFGAPHLGLDRLRTQESQDGRSLRQRENERTQRSAHSRLAKPQLRHILQGGVLRRTHFLSLVRLSTATSRTILTRHFSENSIIMEYCDGGDLYQRITQHQKRGTNFSEAEIWKIFIQVYSFLSHCRR